MPDTNFDLDLENTEDLQQPKFEPLKNGHYNLVVAKVPTVKETQPSAKNPEGAIMIMMEYNTENQDTGVAQKVWDNLLLTKNSLWKIRQWLLSLGYKGANMSTAQILDEDFLNELVSKECTADLVTKNNEYPKGSGNWKPQTSVAQYTSDAIPSRNTKESGSPAYGSSAGPDDLDDIPF